MKLSHQLNTPAYFRFDEGTNLQIFKRNAAISLWCCAHLITDHHKINVNYHFFAEFIQRSKENIMKLKLHKHTYENASEK